MYNLQFDAAHQTFHRFEAAHPDDPLGPVSDAAAYLFHEFDRLKILRSDFFTNDSKLTNGKALKPDPAIKQHFEADLDKTKQLAGAILARQPDNEQAMFATVLRLALQADYDALVDKRYGKSLSEIKAARNEATKLLAKYPHCYDANLAPGVENYLLSQKPAPVRWLLSLTGAQTDKQKGIQDLKLVAEKGNYLKPYAKILLAIAALRSHDNGRAKQLLTELAQQFPHNDLFQQELKRLT
jgi:hypothetical protein